LLALIICIGLLIQKASTETVLSKFPAYRFTIINHSSCKDALIKLFVACFKNTDLKEGIAKVLQGYCYVEDSTCLVSIMREWKVSRY
jgi:hypothetical protein